MNIGVSNRQWRWFDTIHSFIKWVHNYHLKKKKKKNNEDTHESTNYITTYTSVNY